jgi:hypothetical protein
MIEISPEHKPFYFSGTALLGVQVVYFLNIDSSASLGWATWVAVLCLALSIPLLVAAALGFIVGYEPPAKVLLRAGLLTGALWFFAALAAISVWVSLLSIFIGIVSYKMLQFHHKDVKEGKVSAQQGVQRDGSAAR